MMGMGHPQKRCRLTNQSRRRKLTLRLTDALSLEPLDALRDGFVFFEAVQPGAVDVGAVAAVRLAVPTLGWLHRANDR